VKLTRLWDHGGAHRKLASLTPERFDRNAAVVASLICPCAGGAGGQHLAEDHRSSGGDGGFESELGRNIIREVVHFAGMRPQPFPKIYIKLLGRCIDAEIAWTTTHRRVEEEGHGCWVQRWIYEAMASAFAGLVGDMDAPHGHLLSLKDLCGRFLDEHGLAIMVKEEDCKAVLKLPRCLQAYARVITMMMMMAHLLECGVCWDGWPGES
jgi:hypothetical protein